jgi:hypothetical protein
VVILRYGFATSKFDLQVAVLAAINDFVIDVNFEAYRLTFRMEMVPEQIVEPFDVTIWYVLTLDVHVMVTRTDGVEAGVPHQFDDVTDAFFYVLVIPIGHGLLPRMKSHC